jgi:hypothetical protein
MSELQQFLELKSKQAKAVQPTTLKKYEDQYKRLAVLFKRKGNFVLELSEEEIIDVLDKLDITATGKLNHLNIVVMIKNQHKQDIPKLLAYREELFKLKDLQTSKKVVEKLSTLPSYGVIKSFIQDLYTQQDWSRYLVNELIFLYGFRNKDVNLFIIPFADYRLMKKNEKEKEEAGNWLILKKNSCDLVINQYKTKTHYGSKLIPVKSKKILEASTKLGTGYLLQDRNGLPVPDTNIGYYIRLYELNGYQLKEGDYFKINIQHLQTLPNPINKVKELAYTRGTRNLNDIDKYYNLENGKEEELIKKLEEEM